MKTFITLMFISLIMPACAQVGIGTTSPQSSLDIVSSDSGILIPRISLSMTTVMAPVVGATESEMVYNTATTGDVVPGFYYWDSIKWVSIVRPSNDVFWAKDNTYRSVVLPVTDSTWPGGANAGITLSVTVNPGEKIVFGGSMTITQDNDGPDNNGMLDFKMKMITVGNGAAGIPAKSVWGPGGQGMDFVKNITVNGILSTEIIPISGYYSVPITAAPGTTIVFRVEFGTNAAWQYEPAVQNSYIWAMKM